MWIPIRYNARHLVTRWKSTLVTAGTFALVVATFIIVMSLSRGVESSLRATGDPLNIIVLRPGVESESQSEIGIEGYQTIRNLPGIAAGAQGEPLAAPEVIALVNKPRAADGKTTNLQIRGVQAQGAAIRPAVRITSGRMFQPGMREVIVSESVSRRFAGFGLGARVHLGRGEWTIAGVFDAHGTAFDSEVWADCREIMQEFDRTGYNTVVARVTSPGAVDAIKKRIEGDKRLKLTIKTEQQYYEEQTMTSGPIKAFATFLAVIMSIGASFSGMNTMYASVAGRVREIGTLRVIGFSPAAVLASFMLESVLLALAGGAAGCVMALPMNGIATGTTNLETFSEMVFYFTITPGLMLEGLLFAACMGLVGGFLPAWSASRQPVLAAMRQL